MSATEKYIILKLDEASAEEVGRPTVWVQMGETERPDDFFGGPEKVLREWLGEPGQQATAAGTYLVARTDEDNYRVGLFEVAPRVEFDVARADKPSVAGGLEVVA